MAWGRIAAWLLVLGTACSLPESWKTARPRQANRQLSHPGTPRLAAGEIPEGSPRLPAEIAAGPKLDELPEGQPGLVVFVVLDTVRSDRLSACGYERPTSPSIDKLVSLGATLACRAYAPATWTLPSHATFFTGLEVERHGMLRKGVALPEDLPTLAEAYAKRGYQTVLVSANPLLKKATGLTRGFHRAQVAPGLVSPFRGAGLTKMVRYELAQIDPTRPLFLVVNVFDAHEPYPEIPIGTAWATPQPPTYFHNPTIEGPGPYERFARGEMSEVEKVAWLATVENGYDQGLIVADDNLGKLVQLLERHGLGKHGVRLVVVSDHGENLGEHGTVRHDGPPWEAVARVPLLFWESGGRKVELPEPLSASVAYHLALDGSLPETLPEVRSGSIHYGTSEDPRIADALAIWPGGTRKLWWWTDRAVALDLARDPGEAGTSNPTDAERVRLTDASTALLAAKERALALPTVQRVGQLLRELGYTEGEEASAGDDQGAGAR